jgi:integral membrane sensor domain MASE1
LKTQPIPQSPSFLRGIMELAATAALYVVFGKIGFLVAIPPGNVTTVWPAAGIALAAILLLGKRVWPGVYLGSFIVNCWFFWGLTKSFSPISIVVSGSIAVGSTLQALAAAYLIRRINGSGNQFAQPNDTFRFVGIELLTSSIASSVGVTSLCAGSFSHWSAFTETWSTWYLGDFTGALVVAPLILSWSNKTMFRLRTRHVVEASFSFVLAFATCLFIFLDLQASERFPFYPRPYMFISAMVWAAFRFGQKGVTLLALLVSVVAVWATVHGSGPFLQGNLNNSLLTLDIYLVILTFTGLVLASAVSERSQTADRFRLIFDSAPGAMIMVDRAGSINLVNSQSEKLFGYNREELLGQPIEILVPQRFRTPAYNHCIGSISKPNRHRWEWRFPIPQG